MEIKTTRQTLFYDWLNFLNPVFKLNDVQRKVLSGYLTLHYYSRHRFSDPAILDELLFNHPSTRQNLMKKYKLTEDKFDKIFGTLKSKGFFQEYSVQQGENTKKDLLKINPAITRYPRNEKFEINIQFKVQ